MNNQQKSNFIKANTQKTVDKVPQTAEGKKASPSPFSEPKQAQKTEYVPRNEPRPEFSQEEVQIGSKTIANTSVKKSAHEKPEDRYVDEDITEPKVNSGSKTMTQKIP